MAPHALRRPSVRPLVVGAALWSGACGGEGGPPEGTPGAPGTLLVADADAPVAYVIDLARGATVDAISLAGPSGLARSNGAHAYAVSRAAGVVEVLVPRVAGEGGPAVRIDGAVAAGPAPTALVVNGDVATTFFAGDGSVAWWSDAAVAEGARGSTRLDVAPAHEGVAIALGDDALVVSNPGAATDPADPHLELWGRRSDGTRLERFPGCTAPESVSGSARWVAVACRDAVHHVRLEPETGEAVAGSLTVPLAGPDERVRGLRAAPSGALLVGAFGGTSLVRVEPSTLTRIDLGSRVTDLAFLDDDRLVLLVDGGVLLEADPVEGPTGRSVRVWPDEGDDVRLVVGADAVFLLDASARQVVEVSRATWLPTRTFPLPGPPGSGVVFPPG